MAARSGMGHVTLACDGYPRLVPSDLAVFNNHSACIQLINAAFTPLLHPLGILPSARSQALWPTACRDGLAYPPYAETNGTRRGP
jgi:hypothetical protein